ncbi:metallophosphoesterase [Bradyrhizobium sp. CCGUVB1N3]|uniref:metallophosphoesterase n=1 Tax=Bradyrhizobium sp. CCGUVB1N3 TaxID=2949629 RepID=UPI0020B3D9C2|nr:metallophosphoesterase [Bradyrhizobium sp. CCGUVB1N3]MCP3476715.1 metallophosphoesterase [Bradyrhizobium sp. CCGUVB1N3]
MTFAVGDIHGCFEELRSLLDACRSSAGDIEHNFLFLGDYVDRGPASDEVIACLMREQASAPSRFRCLLGNHDHNALPRGGSEPLRCRPHSMVGERRGGNAGCLRHRRPLRSPGRAPRVDENAASSSSRRAQVVRSCRSKTRRSLGGPIQGRHVVDT